MLTGRDYQEVRSSVIGQVDLSSEIPDVCFGKRKICFLFLVLDSLFVTGLLVEVNVVNEIFN